MTASNSSTGGRREENHIFTIEIQQPSTLWERWALSHRNRTEDYRINRLLRFFLRNWQNAFGLALELLPFTCLLLLFATSAGGGTSDTSDSNAPESKRSSCNRNISATPADLDAQPPVVRQESLELRHRFPF